MVRERWDVRSASPTGRKIGFTNRTIWDEYQIGAPMWGYIYDRTVHDLADVGSTVSLADLAEPRIEPEIVFGLAAAPAPGMDERALLGCVDWLAHGFELVQSIFPRWEFTLPDTVAAYGLHGKLLIGSRHSIADTIDDWARDLSTFRIDLSRNGVVVDWGRASNVLGGPLSALRHLVEVLADDPVNPPLAAGEIVTTGTLTRAFPVAPGETWTTEPKGIALDGIAIRFA
jgi:2-oxo-3-hexenedioate decarboxylase